MGLQAVLAHRCTSKSKPWLPPTPRPGTPPGRFYHPAATDPELAHADAELLEAAARLRWSIDRPSNHHECQAWEMYAFDPIERAKVGRRQREWTTVAPT